MIVNVPSPLRVIFTALLVSAGLVGCAPTAIEFRQIERIPIRVFDPGSVQGLGVPEVKVLLAAGVEYSKVTPKEVAMPLHPAGLIFGPFGALISSLAAVHIENQLSLALNEIDFPKRLQKSIESRLHEDGQSGKPNARLEVVIQRYGFVSGPDGFVSSGFNLDKFQRFCSVIDADITLNIPNEVGHKDSIFWEPFKRSVDIPPPRCESPSVFAAQKGKLARQTL